MLTIRYPLFMNFPNLSDTLEEMDRMRRRMDRVLDAFSGGGGLPAISGVFPPIKVREENGTIHVEAEVPGIRAEDIDISVTGRTLTLKGERKPEEASGASFHRRERGYGSFHKAVTLPEDVNAEAIEAECKDGVLKIVLPKAEHAKPRKIAVKTD
jgi:HSP20 family protein